MKHFLLLCPAYTHKRWALKKSIKGKPTLKTLLGDHTAALLLNNFIKATHRFNSTRTEQEVSRQ